MPYCYPMRASIKPLILLFIPVFNLILWTGLCGPVYADYLSPDTIEGSTKIDAEGLIELADRLDKLVIIDARISADRIQGYIDGSFSLPDTHTTCDSLKRFIPTKTTPVVFYCNGPKCRRSDRAVVIARECGYKNIYWFRGGIEEWKKKNYLITR